MTRTKRRACEGKKAHPTRSLADTELARLISDRGIAPGALEVYRCRFCRDFHIGHTRGTNPRRPM